MSKVSTASAASLTTTKTVKAELPQTTSTSKSESAKVLADKLLTSAASTSPAQVEEMLNALIQASKLPGVVAQPKGLNFLEGLESIINEQVNTQLNEVMHSKEFLKLEGTWRGIQRLLQETDTNKTLWVELLDTTKEELLQDFKDATDYSQSALWKKVYDGRYDVSGGKPYSAFVSGFEFENTPDDIKLLTCLAGVGGAAQAPFIVSGSPKLLGLRSFADLKNLPSIKNTFNSEEYTNWNTLRKNPDSRFLAVTVPRILARLPYGSKTSTADGLNTFEEAPISNRGKLAKMPHEQMCWSSSAYGMGGVLTKAFRKTNFTTAIVGEARKGLNGGTVSDLPLYQYYNEGGNLETTIPTETSITGSNEFALAELGFLPLSYELDTKHGVFVGGKTMFEPGGMKGSDKFNNEFVASVLANVLPAARISHYMKRIGRKFHGQFAQPDDLQRFLNDWLAQFKTDDSTGEVGKTSHPLQDFKVTVEKGWAPGVYDVKVSLKFWDMIYQINADVEMTAKLDTK